jgi:hypothetical protein
VQQDQQGHQGYQGHRGLQAPQDHLYILSRCVVVGVVRVSAIVLVVKLRVRLLGLRLQGAL